MCCCEYENSQGEKSHILACCCDCEALDEMADRCFKCQKIPTSLVDKFIDNLLDRLRLPGLTGGGATRVSLDVATPIVVIPMALISATLGPIITCIVLAILPYFCFFFYRTWKRRMNRSRTQFFFVWGVMSVIYMYIIFEYILCQHSSVRYSDNIVISVTVILMFLALYQAKKDPGIVKTQDEIKLQLRQSFNMNTPTAREEYNQNFIVSQSSGTKVDRYENSAGDSDEIVVQLDPQADKQTENYCDKCNQEKPARAGHCTVCNICIQHRDHHCVWIDSCIGEYNHRAFMVAMTMFVFAGYYGSYVTIATVCKPSPSNTFCDLNVAYRDFQFALCFVSSCYVALVTTIMAVGLVHQIILISQNITSQELHRASKSGTTKCFLIATNNPYDRGFYRNWIMFIMRRTGP